jgi:hypothetical protein
MAVESNIMTIKLRLDHDKCGVYDTTVTRGLKDKMVKMGISLEGVLALHGADSDNFTVRESVYALRGNAEQIHAFPHPVYHGGKAFVDARPFTNNEGQIRNMAEFRFLEERGQMEVFWMHNTLEWAGHAGFVSDIFGSWMSNCVTRRLNMSIMENQQLRILGCIYYLRPLLMEMSASEEDIIAMVVKLVPKYLRLPAEMVDTLITGHETVIAELFRYTGDKSEQPGYYLQKMCDIFNAVTDNSYKLNPAVIFQCCCNGAFICVNSQELASIAIEHPPTFMLMMYHCMQKGPQSKTNIGLTVQGLMKKHNDDAFIKMMHSNLVF